jgi:hypothetical protein
MPNLFLTEGECFLLKDKMLESKYKSKESAEYIAAKKVTLKLMKLCLNLKLQKEVKK